MGKIVKYCAACEESFSEKFAFCPNCAQPMTAFEMNPIVKSEPVVEEIKPNPVEEITAAAPGIGEPVFRTSEPISLRTASPLVETAPVVETPLIIEDEPTLELPTEPILEIPTVADTRDNQPSTFFEEIIADDALVNEPPVEETPIEPAKTFAAAAGANGNGNFAHSNAYQTAAVKSNQTDDVFNVTVIEEKNGKQRNVLLLGSMVVVLTLALGGTVYSLFTKDAGVGAIGDESLFAAIVVEDVPMEVEEQPKPKDKEAGGGGGGGGKEEPEPASKGRLVSQSENPITPPSAKVPQLTNPSIPIIQETKGNIKRPITEERAGLPGSDNLNPSNGRGSGGGIGSGVGTGIGTGIGTGEGSGRGSGSGGGDGDGNGDGRGSGTGAGAPPPPPSRPVEVVTTPFRIISKPRPGYTDAARQNQVTGVVRLKVTFLASGAIGSIAPVSGLPYGLTEQAIAAARNIKFEPQKKNGTAVAVTKTIEYSFSIY